MNEFHLLAAVIAGAACTLIAVWLLSLVRATRELGDAAREVRDLAAALRPTAERIDRLGAAAEASEPDLRRLQSALRGFSRGSEQLGEAFSRSAGWIGAALPLLEIALERWRARDDQSTEPEPAGTDARNPVTPQQEIAWHPNRTPQPRSSSHATS